ncbi:NADH dehydrogenase, alpha subcomplex, subunit 8 [Fistulina hepatica ATCC 64428]|uniref:NADH-ubiquinone oxidoreductase n=1 Tax=Fistulina hepatica ATCC 64428 TaxID=1128425 RepID=A0A0D7ALJ3_9AGAR|nr:NADH dehydrogenase, alpha subcomplex, subunit 8 [Fistulina hepatica ATCC 64428]
MSFVPGSRTPQAYVEPAPMPEQVPKVEELGVTSAPLKSAAFFIGSHCQAYNEDFMLCKAENPDPAHCLLEGRRVTRCARDMIEKMRANCNDVWSKHWECLERENHEYYRCRDAERPLNKCMFEKLGLRKTIPGSPEDRPQIHENTKPLYKRQQH